MRSPRADAPSRHGRIGTAWLPCPAVPAPGASLDPSCSGGRHSTAARNGHPAADCQDRCRACKDAPQPTPPSISSEVGERVFSSVSPRVLRLWCTQRLSKCSSAPGRTKLVPATGPCTLKDRSGIKTRNLETSWKRSSGATAAGPGTAAAKRRAVSTSASAPGYVLFATLISRDTTAQFGRNQPPE